ncbi:metal-dependent hydrolase [Aminobacter sp. HY435]|uniref:metal-dependent hydrolase n=1 Tax=Aminobacter sp. HY435 TaxID=2970917 RepID=UPI0022B9CC81|nr:metal-dependent hydrolase [Aminobacter sp. HY435]
MLIAHLPAGYIIGSVARKAVPVAPGVMFAALAGSVAPDFDIAWFWLADNGAVHHSTYPTHWPLFWAVVAIVAMPLVAATARRWSAASAVFFLAVFSHMVLDSVTAPMFWLMPFDGRAVELVPIPPAHSHWVLSFVLHWSFALEIGVCAVAIWMAVKNAARRELLKGAP